MKNDKGGKIEDIVNQIDLALMKLQLQTLDTDSKLLRETAKNTALDSVMSAIETTIKDSLTVQNKPTTDIDEVKILEEIEKRFQDKFWGEFEMNERNMVWDFFLPYLKGGK